MLKSSSHTFGAVLVLLFSSFISVIYESLEQSDHVLIIVYFMFITFYLVNLKRTGWVYSLAAFLLFITLIPIYHLSFYEFHGSYFTPGGDAEKYYNYAIGYGLNNDEIIGYRYWFFIWLVGNYYKIINLLGGTDSIVFFSFLTSFIASLTVVFYYLAVNNLSGVNNAKKTAILWSITPLFIFLAVGQLRDVFAYIAPAYSFYYFSLERDKRQSIKKIASLTLVIAYAALIRIDVAIYCVVFSTFFYMFDGKFSGKKILLLIFAGIMMFLFLVFFETVSEQVTLNNINIQTEIYREQSLSDSSSNIGALKGSFLGLVILSIISYFTPFPTFVLDGKYTFFYFLEMIFVIIWAAGSYFFIKSSFIIKQDCFKKSFLLSLAFLLVLLGLTTVGFFRQKLYVYPIIYYYIIDYIESHLVNREIIRYLSLMLLVFSISIFYFLFRVGLR